MGVRTSNQVTSTPALTSPTPLVFSHLQWPPPVQTQGDQGPSKDLHPGQARPPLSAGTLPWGRGLRAAEGPWVPCGDWQPMLATAGTALK